MPQPKIKCYVFDWGDTPLIVNDLKPILDMIEEGIRELPDTEELNYTITIKYMTERQYINLPEWS